jgi:hypothetical protein
MYILGIGNEGVARGGRRFELYDEGAWSVGGGAICVLSIGLNKGEAGW